MAALDLAIVVDAFVDGDLQRVKGKEGVRNSECFRDAFTSERVKWFKTRYKDLTLKYVGKYADETTPTVEETS
jgi:hypothetical protein